ncbi:hypothetical protein [Enhygromyxa salina]|uniref:Lipoprotein n=1 Tax=Enhygromyxa salina TaxID=215803 RepID=A0A2S9YYI3_9BACT|nr:hypothetical protein [Enhygromyxa salina]PRQ10137.1 hypothetical protein ENSA7_00860 [Enhygromyxa salina]
MRAVITCALAMLITTQTGCAGARQTSSTQADPCADFEVQVETYWSAAIKAQALQHGGEIELEKRSGVVNKMDRISEDWVMMRTSVCKDHFVRALISKDEYAARVRCFDDRLERQRTLAQALAGEGELAAVEGAVNQLVAAPPSCQTHTASDPDPGDQP